MKKNKEKLGLLRQTSGLRNCFDYAFFNGIIANDTGIEGTVSEDIITHTLRVVKENNEKKHDKKNSYLGEVYNTSQIYQRLNIVKKIAEDNLKVISEPSVVRVGEGGEYLTNDNINVVEKESSERVLTTLEDDLQNFVLTGEGVILLPVTTYSDYFMPDHNTHWIAITKDYILNHKKYMFFGFFPKSELKYKHEGNFDRVIHLFKRIGNVKKVNLDKYTDKKAKGRKLSKQSDLFKANKELDKEYITVREGGLDNIVYTLEGKGGNAHIEPYFYVRVSFEKKKEKDKE